MLDRDLAELYQIKTIALNQAVKRNAARFPESFRFQLTDSETNELITNCDRFQSLKHSSSTPGDELQPHAGRPSFYSNDLNPHDSYDRNRGFSVRLVR